MFGTKYYGIREQSSHEVSLKWLLPSPV